MGEKLKNIDTIIRFDMFMTHQLSGLRQTIVIGGIVP